MEHQNTQIIILAAGQGKRMGGDLPKALTDLSGRPMMDYTVDTAQSATQTRPIAVVGYKQDLIKEFFGDRCIYAHQSEQKGTGHAALCAESLVEDHIDTIVILNADMPFVSVDTIKNLIKVKKEKEANIVIATLIVEDESLFENQFYNFGRIVRDPITHQIEAIVEKKDADSEQVKIREVNPAFFCCDKKWAFDRLKSLNNNNAQGEYYLTDLIGLAFNEGSVVYSVQSRDPREALGANTPEQLEVLKLYLDK